MRPRVGRVGEADAQSKSGKVPRIPFPETPKSGLPLVPVTPTPYIRAYAV